MDRGSDPYPIPPLQHRQQKKNKKQILLVNMSPVIGRMFMQLDGVKVQKIGEVCKISPRIPEEVWDSWGSDHVWGSHMQAFLQRPH